MPGPTNVLLLSPYAGALLPTFKRAGDRVHTVWRADDPEFAVPPDDLWPQWIVLYGWPHVLRDDVYWRHYKGRVINLHISLLPWNRGADPNFWSWREDTPKGVTIHQVDKDLDTGPVLIASEEGLDGPNHTLASSYEALSAAVERLFATHWVGIRDGEIGPREQGPGGSSHKRIDIEPFRWALKDWSLPCSEAAGLEPRP